MKEVEPLVLNLGDLARDLDAVSNIEFDLSNCYGCARCSSVCKVALFSTSPEKITPRYLLHEAILGEPGQLLESDFIWLCSGCRRCEESCPQKVRISEVVKALRRLSSEAGNHNPFAARVNERICMHCGACVDACPNDAVLLVESGPRGLVARVDPNDCRGCGICSAVCSNGAIQQSIANHIEIRKPGVR